MEVSRVGRKSRRGSGQVETCTYCYKSVITEREHVVGKAFFASPLPSNMITVPACRTCNSTLAKAEEYVRTVLVSSQAAISASTTAQRLAEGPVSRSLLDPAFPGMLNLLRRAARRVSAFSKGGIYVKDQTALFMDKGRFSEAVEKIVRGLYRHVRKEILPAGYRVLVHPNPEEIPKDNRILAALACNPPIVLGDDVFECRYAFVDFDPAASIWSMVFYRSVEVLAFTAGPDLAESVRILAQLSEPAREWRAPMVIQ